MEYMYGITQKILTAPLQITGVESQSVYEISSGNLSVICSSIPPAFSINPTRKNVFKHADVVDVFFNIGPVIPFRFGTVCKNREGVLKMITARYQDVRNELKRLKETVEYSINVQLEQKYFQPKNGQDYLISKLHCHQRIREIGEMLNQNLRDLFEDRKSNDDGDEDSNGQYYFLVKKRNETRFTSVINQLKIEEPFYLTGPWPPYNFCKLVMNHG